MRQWIESVFDTMKGQLTHEGHGGRTVAGVYSRVAGSLRQHRRQERFLLGGRPRVYYPVFDRGDRKRSHLDDAEL